ncbi:MAG: acetyltransferase [Deltaproteobacteria bacterium]
MREKVAIIGYSGHSYVVIDIIESMGSEVAGYFDKNKKDYNPYSLEYLGDENEPPSLESLKSYNWFVAIGDNHIRHKIITSMLAKGLHDPLTIFHKNSVVSKTASVGYGTMFAAGSIVNPLARIGNGVICNTGSIIEHECKIGDFSHIGPGAVLAGNVHVGEMTFVGANSVIKQGVKIGNNVTIGAGTVVINDVPDNATIVGNPGRIIK